MRKKQQQEYVRTITTGHVEADMLGQCMIIAEEMKGKQNTSQRPHREGMIVNKLTGVLKWFQTAPTALLRKLQYANKYGRKLASVLRRKRVNGK
tara:strand:+ start:898 stop:1179 length:282 start_codon:yes stop_codon:yes gene_type:complete